jgi:hypothetical protein
LDVDVELAMVDIVYVLFYEKVVFAGIFYTVPICIYLPVNANMVFGNFPVSGSTFPISMVRQVFTKSLANHMLILNISVVSGFNER